MKNRILSEWLIEIISALFILLFLYTALSKIYEHKSFQIILSKSPLIGNFSKVISYILPIAEIIVSLCLLMPMTRSKGLWGSLFLMCVFTIYIAYMIIYSPKLPCSCGGVLKKLNWTQHLLFNIFFTLLNIFALWLLRKNKIVIAINRNSRTPV